MRSQQTPESTILTNQMVFFFKKATVQMSHWRLGQENKKDGKTNQKQRGEKKHVLYTKMYPSSVVSKKTSSKGKTNTTMSLHKQKYITKKKQLRKRVSLPFFIRLLFAQCAQHSHLSPPGGAKQLHPSEINSAIKTFKIKPYHV